MQTNFYYNICLVGLTKTKLGALEHHDDDIYAAPHNTFYEH